MMIPFEPIAYDHAARLINRRPWEVSRSSDLLIAAHEKAIASYQTPECVLGIDIYNVEIEAYGCPVLEPQGNGLPSAGPAPFDEVEQILDLKLNPETDGRIPMLLAAATTLAARHPELRVRIPMAGPFTILCHLLGMENTLCELMTDPDPVSEALLHLADNQILLAAAARSRGIGITLFDSSVTPPLLSPELFSTRVQPSLSRLLNALPAGVRQESQLIIGGDTLPILESLLALDPAYLICPAETDQSAFMKKMASHPQSTVRINMNPACFCTGQEMRVTEELNRILPLALQRPGTRIGSLLPYNADPGQVMNISQRIQQEVG